SRREPAFESGLTHEGHERPAICPRAADWVARLVALVEQLDGVPQRLRCICGLALGAHEEEHRASHLLRAVLVDLTTLLLCASGGRQTGDHQRGKRAFPPNEHRSLLKFLLRTTRRHSGGQTTARRIDPPPRRLAAKYPAEFVPSPVRRARHPRI